jgi:DNA topoisomerase-2
MVLFNQKEQLKKYSIDEIIQDFCVMRFEYYIKRKKYTLNNLNKELKHNQNKARFIEEIINKKLNIMNIEEEVVIKELEKRGYDKEIKNTDSEENSAYNYLLKLQVRTFTSNKVSELKEEIKRLENRIKIIKETSEKQLWLNDLIEFENEYKKWEKSMNENDNKEIKKNKKK